MIRAQPVNDLGREMQPSRPHPRRDHIIVSYTVPDCANWQNPQVTKVPFSAGHAIVTTAAATDPRSLTGGVR